MSILMNVFRHLPEMGSSYNFVGICIIVVAKYPPPNIQEVITLQWYTFNFVNNFTNTKHFLNILAHKDVFSFLLP